MGGCRCYFRNCKVNTNKCPGMHYFRFPLKDRERCELWIKYTQQYDLLTLPLGRQRNMSICARHFKDECFMNYKKDRLTGAALPSIHRLSKDKALDFEMENEHGVLVTLPDPDQAHLIAPPDFECPLGFGVDTEASKLLTRALERETSADYLTENEDVEEPSTGSMLSNDLVELEMADATGMPEEGGGYKRSATSALGEETLIQEGNHTVKRSRANNHTDNDCVSIVDDAVVRSESSETSSQPTIINHQILDTGGHIWLESETFCLQEGDGFQFVEVQPQAEERETEQILQIAEELHEDIGEADDISLTDDSQLSRRLEEACNEIEVMRAQLSEEKAKVKTLELNLSTSRMECARSEQQVANLKVTMAELETTNEELEGKSMETEIIKLQLEYEKEERTKLETELSALKQENTSFKNDTTRLKTLLVKANNEISELKRIIENSDNFKDKETTLRKEYEEQLKSQQEKQAEIEQELQQQTTILEQSLDLARQQLAETKNSLSLLKTECACLKSERLTSVQKVLVAENELQKIQDMYDNKDEQLRQLENSNQSLQKSYEKLKADYIMLESSQNQVSTVTTSSGNRAAAPVLPQLQQPVVATLTKAQLFNGIKRYISSSMCSLLRMEMFGSAEREWKPDERQVAVDVLRLGETVYKYLTDEWRFRLPALRDVRNWLSQSATLDDEEDL